MSEKVILFYVGLKDISLFYTQMFYINTLQSLESAGYKVIVTNKIKDAITKQYDGILVFFYRIGTLPALFAKLRCKKVFFTGGNDAMDRRYARPKDYWIQVVLFKLCQRIADACLIESTNDLDNMRKVCHNKNINNLYYSPQAINVKQYENNIVKNKNFTTICWQGNVENVKRKGVDTALYYFKYIKTNSKEFIDSKLYILGRNGEGTKYLKCLIELLDLNQEAIIVGEVAEEDKIIFLQNSKYFFQLSKVEGFGLAALEALASKCIIIHTGKGGLSDTVAGDGVLVNIDNFNDSINSIDITILQKLKQANSINFDKVLKRLYSTSDKSVRVDNFKRILGEFLPVD
jgi:glycosyltransferase involved in cell wall biosynthesis